MTTTGEGNSGNGSGVNGGAADISRSDFAHSNLGLMLASFAAGRLRVGISSLPLIVANLPGDESEFSHELDLRIRERFPVGTSEDKLLEFLADERFAPEWRRRDDPNAAVFLHQGLLCAQMVRILWRADATGILTEVHGEYQGACGSRTFPR